MAVEIREMVVRTTISGEGPRESKASLSCNGLEEMKQEVLAICMERIAEYLEKQKER